MHVIYSAAIRVSGRRIISTSNRRVRNSQWSRLDFCLVPRQLPQVFNGATWNDFRKSQCDLAPTNRAKSGAVSDSTIVALSAVFPSAVDSKYASEKSGRARRKTCLDQYKANKASNANGGLKWLQRGGGYYSQCVKKLKGAA